MIIETMEQGSLEWFYARVGIPTASCFDKILSPTGKPSTQSGAYMNKLLAEWMLGEKEETHSSEWMERGILLEVDARNLYLFQTENAVEEVGIVYKDELRQVACSPDGLGDKKGLEIKCPAPHTHVDYLLANKLPTKYIPQVQGSMFVTGFDEWDFMSYHPDMPPMIITVKRDNGYIEKLDLAITKFNEKMQEKKQKLTEIGA